MKARRDEKPERKREKGLAPWLFVVGRNFFVEMQIVSEGKRVAPSAPRQTAFQSDMKGLFFFKADQCIYR